MAYTAMQGGVNPDRYFFRVRTVNVPLTFCPAHARLMPALSARYRTVHETHGTILYPEQKDTP